MRFFALLAALFALPVLGQNTVTLTPSVTSGNGSIVTDLTWSTNPPLPTGTPCVASGHPSWTGPKAGSGTQAGLTITTSGTLSLSLTCTFGGDSIVEFSWVNATTNTDNTPYTNRRWMRIKYSFAATLTSGEVCGTGETCVDVDDSAPTRPTMRTVTGISQVGTLRARAFHINTLGVASDPSNAVTKTFTGAVPVTQTVSITVNPKPGAPTSFVGQ